MSRCEDPAKADWVRHELGGAVRGRRTATLDGLWMLTSNLPRAVLGQIFLSGGSFLASLLVARGDSRGGFGAFALSYAILLGSNSVLMAVLLKPFTLRQAGCDAREAESRASMYLAAQMTCSMLLGALVCLVALRVVARETVGTFLALGVAMPAVHSLELLRRVQLAKLAVTRVLLYDGVFFAVYAGGLLGWFALGYLDGTVALLQLSASAGVSAAVALRDVEVRRPRWEAMREEFAQAWSFGRWSSLVTMVDIVETRAHVFLAASILGLGGAATLEAGRLLVAPTNVLVFPVLNLLMPMAVGMHRRGDWRSLRYLIVQAMAVVGGGVSLYALALYLAAEPILAVVYGGRYGDAAGVVGLFGLYCAIACVSVVASVSLESAGGPRAVFWAQLVNVLVALTVAWSTLEHLGPAGAVVGMVAGASIGLLIKLLVMKRPLTHGPQPVVRLVEVDRA